MAMHLIGVYFIGIHLMGMHLMGMHLLMGMRLKGVAESVSDPWGAMYNGSPKNSASRGTSNGPAGWAP
jgi:hypothetical protein